MFTFEEVSSSVCAGLHQLIGRLEPLRSEEPWTRLEVGQRINALPTVVDLACRLALTLSPKDGLCRRMLESAAAHGYTRRSQGLPEFILQQELAIVRQAIWLDLHQRYGHEGDVIADVILRIDRAFTLAFQGSLRGYFRAEFEGLGNWPDALLVLESEWSVPAVPTSAARRVPERWAVRHRREKGGGQRYRRTRDEPAAKLPQLPNSISP